jgi:hypothetical protein
MWSLMKRIRLPVETAKQFGFVPHGRAFPQMEFWQESLPVDQVLAASCYPHFFTVELDSSTAKSTLQLFVNAKEAGREIKGWTGFVKQLPRKKGGGIRHAAFYAFSNEEDAIWARLSFE